MIETSQNDRLEIWKDVVGYEGKYIVSNLGNVSSVDRYVNNKVNGKTFIKGMQMKLQTSHKGYKTLILHDGSGNPKTKQVHRLVAMAFIPNIFNLEQVNHKDTNKTNNHVDNLEWITNYDNMQHAIRNNCFGGRTTKQTEAVRRNLLHAMQKRIKPIIQCSLDGIVIQKFSSIADAERTTGVNNSKICECCKGKRKTAGGYKWKYYEKENVYG